MTDVQEFAQSFRGYDKAQVDAEIDRLRSALDQSRSSAQAAAQQTEAQLANHRDDMSAAERRITGLETDLIEMQSRLQAAESRAELLGQQATAGDDESPARFQEILRVAEEQASALIDNAVQQADRIVDDARKQIEKDRAVADEESQRVREEAKHEERQARLRIETERTAHVAEIEQREATLGEQVSRAESEAAVLVGEAERATAALRQQTTQEADAMKAEAERILRDARARELELDAAVKRRQDEAQQEFLRLHNHAIAHAERITSDANEKVASALRHANHISEQAQAFEDLAKAQATHVERASVTKANAILHEARQRAQTIVDSVLSHSKDVLHEAEDRARTLRFQQQQLTGFRAELQQLMQIAEATRAALPTQGDDDDASAAPASAGGSTQASPSGAAAAAVGGAAAAGAAAGAAAATEADDDAPLEVATPSDDAADEAVTHVETETEVDLEEPDDEGELTGLAAEDRDVDVAPEVVQADLDDDALGELELVLDDADANAQEEGSGIVSQSVEVVWHEDADD